MTQKNAKKTAARARQAHLGGKYASHFRHVVASASSAGDFEPTPQPLEEPAYPDSEFTSQLRGEPSAVVDMCDWFFRRFEDPANGVPYDSGEGGYQYVLGGPSHPWDELPFAFPNAQPAHLERAVDIITGYGWEWVPVGLY